MLLPDFATGGKMINVTNPYPIYNGAGKITTKNRSLDGHWPKIYILPFC